MARRRFRNAVTACALSGALGVGAFAFAAAPASATATGVALTSSINPSAYGQNVKLRALVSDPSTPKAQITGTMTFSDGAALLGTATVTNGAATFATKTLGAGTHAITASFADTAGNAPVVSSPLTETVATGATTTTLTTTNATAYNGQAGNVIATVAAVAPASGVPTGSVDFSVAGSVWWTSPVAPNGTATLPFANLGAGTFDITATYSGDGNFTASSSATPLTQTILVNAPAAGLSFTPAVVAPGAVSRLVVSATNNGPIPMPNVALGVMLPMNATIVSAPAGVGCRRSGALLYCMTSLGRGATRKLVLDVTAPTALGTYTVHSYARNIDTGDETSAGTTLTVQ